MEDYLKYQNLNISLTTGLLSRKLYAYTYLTKPSQANVSNEDDLKWKMTSNGRLPKKAKFKYLSNHWSDLSQILNLSFCDQTKPYKYFR